MTHVFIADDHAIVRRGIQEILRDTSDMTMSGEAGTTAELLERIPQSHVDVLLLDISMPGRSGLDALNDVKREFPSLAVLVLSMHPEEQFAVRAIKAGASGFLEKSSASDELIKAIRTLSSGRKYLSPRMVERIACDMTSDDHKPLHEALTDREFQVIRLIAVGRKARQIADELMLSVRTVNTYRARIMEKMQLKSNAEMVRYSIEYGLVA